MSKKELEELFKNPAILNTILTKLPIGLCLMDHKSKLIWGNDKFTAWFGCLKNLIGRPCSLFLETGKKSNHLSAKNLKTKNNESYYCYGATSKTRNIFFESITTPISDSQGKIKYIMNQLTDITKYKQVEKILIESEKRFNDVAENALVWIWEVDVEGKYIYASSAVENIMGYKPEEVLKKHFYDLFHPDNKEKMKNAAFKAFAKKKPFREFLNLNIHKNGKEIWLSTSGMPIINEKGKLIGYRGTDTDITENTKYKKKLEKANIELQHNIEELEKMNDLMIDRELMMINLKKKLKRLEKKA